MSRWTLFAHNGIEYGNIEEKELISWIKEKRIALDDLVRRDGAREWEVIGEVEIFSRYFKDKPPPAGKVKKMLKNESERLKDALKKVETKIIPIKNDSSGLKCEGCSFIESVERLHEEKKVLEEKLAENRAKLRIL